MQNLEKLNLLRKAMAESSVTAYVIQNTDPHLGENIPEHWCIIHWLTGFTGSLAIIVITADFAGLWTDSRYFIQAEKQLENSGFILAEHAGNQLDGHIGWLAGNMREGDTVALDGRIFPTRSIRKMRDSFKAGKINLVIDCDLIAAIWAARPAMPLALARDFPVTLSGKSREMKLSDLRSRMEEEGVSYHLLTSADDINWLLNIRGGDLKYSPLVLCFAVVSKDQVLLFADEEKFPLALAAEFDTLGIVILPYDEAGAVLASLPPASGILVSPAATSVALYESLPKRMKKKEGSSIPSLMKAVKNKTEIDNIGKAMVRDGVALTRFFHWLETSYGTVPMSELSLTEKLNHFRSLQEGYICLSFHTILAIDEHGALPHYSADQESDIETGINSIILVDSGSHYDCGTTDITRTVPAGSVTDRQKRDFTLVLKAMISLSVSKFPAGTSGSQLDVLARSCLWNGGLNYGHGTGHGVGYCLNVHESPPGISPSVIDHDRDMKPGMLVSNEPAVYRRGEYGIRTENLMISYQDEETEFGKFMKFETVSLCHIDKKLIDLTMLDEKEKNWLNDYHSTVYDKLSPYLNPDEKRWLKEKTAAV